VVICAEVDADTIQASIPERTWRIGSLAAGTGIVHLLP
jgi:hypothetical protein